MLENAKRWVNPINTSNKAKKIRRSIMAGLAAFAVAVLLFAQIVLSADEAKMPAQESLYARSAALIDGDTGRLLYGKEEDVILPMASTTKIMTCILVLEMMEPEEICTASAYAASQPQVHLGVQKGWSFRCEDLLYSLMLESHNDTAVILAEAAAGSVEGFATWMNKKAKEIGLSQTHFVTPNGLDNEAHYTTARELASRGITCNAIAPGFIETDMTGNQTDNPLLDMIPLSKMGEPEDVADAVAYLATAKYVTGEVLRVDGGIAM